jgi:hypothetical protein
MAERELSHQVRAHLVSLEDARQLADALAAEARAAAAGGGAQVIIASRIFSSAVAACCTKDLRPASPIAQAPRETSGAVALRNAERHVFRQVRVPPPSWAFGRRLRAAAAEIKRFDAGLGLRQGRSARRRSRRAACGPRRPRRTWS